MGEKRNTYRLLVGKPEGRRPLGRPRRRWVDSIRMDLAEVGWADVDWIDLAQDRDRWRALVNSVFGIKGRRPLGRPRRTWLDLVEVGGGDVNWIGLAQDRGRWRALVNSVLNLRVP
jgi:hypothetical protein